MKFRWLTLLFVGAILYGQTQISAAESNKTDDELYTEFVVLRASVDELKGLVSGLKGEVANYRAELAYLQDNLSRTSESLGKMMEQKAVLQRELDSLAAQRRREQNTLDDLRNQISREQKTPAAPQKQAVAAVLVKSPVEQTTPVIGETTLLKTIYFAPDASNVDSFFFPYLDEVGKQMAANPQMKITIRGYSNAAGTPSGQRKVSRERAEQTAKYLQRTFSISADRVVVEWVGADKLPLATTITESTRRAVQLFSL